MRRNAENLFILSGSEPARRWRGAIDLGEVVRASVEEVKEHTRVELLPLDQVQLAGHAAADVMHLLAELIENAVTFSAPGTKALVAGQPLPAGYLLQIEDQGLGMTDEQLVKVNQRLARPPDIDSRVPMVHSAVPGVRSSRGRRTACPGCRPRGRGRRRRRAGSRPGTWRSGTGPGTRRRRSRSRCRSAAGRRTRAAC